MTKHHMPELDAYYDEVSKAILCKSNIKKTFIRDLKDRIDEFLEENEGASTEDVINHFGKPEEIASTFLETFSAGDIKRAMNWKKFIIAGVIAALFILVVFLVLAFIDGANSTRGYAVEGVALEDLEVGES